MLFWIVIGIVYFIGSAIGFGYCSERYHGFEDGPAPLLGLLWPLMLLAIPLATIALVGYLPYRLGMFFHGIPDLLVRRRERLAEIERRIRGCEHCGEPHDPEDECEEDALMGKS